MGFYKSRNLGGIMRKIFAFCLFSALTVLLFPACTPNSNTKKDEKIIPEKQDNAINTSSNIKELNETDEEPNFWLPEDFKVYAGGDSVGTMGCDENDAKILPTVNHYKGKDGGYVAIYTREQEGSIYSVGGGIYVIGQIGVKGVYIGRIFHPEGYSEGADITQDKNILEICNQYFPKFKGKMWIGGDTGGWFGL